MELYIQNGLLLYSEILHTSSPAKLVQNNEIDSFNKLGSVWNTEIVFPFL